MAEILGLGIGTTFDYSVPFNVMVGMIKEAGFDAVLLGGGDVGHSGYDNPERRKMIRKVLSEHEIVLDSIHAPFGKKRDISSANAEIRSFGCSGTRTALDACYELGTDVTILHLNFFFPESEYKKRLQDVRESLEGLIPYAERLGVKLAVENLSGPQGMRLFDNVLESYSELKVCYDSSHDYLNGTYSSGESFKVLDKYSERLVALHLSDGYRNMDDHLPLYHGEIDWEEFGRHFLRTTYSGPLLLEVETKSTGYEDPVAFLKEAYKGAVRLLKSLQRGGE